MRYPATEEEVKSFLDEISSKNYNRELAEAGLEMITEIGKAYLGDEFNIVWDGRELFANKGNIYLGLVSAFFPEETKKVLKEYEKLKEHGDVVSVKKTTLRVEVPGAKASFNLHTKMGEIIVETVEAFEKVKEICSDVDELRNFVTVVEGVVKSVSFFEAVFILGPFNETISLEEGGKFTAYISDNSTPKSILEKYSIATSLIESVPDEYEPVKITVSEKGITANFSRGS